MALLSAGDLGEPRRVPGSLVVALQRAAGNNAVGRIIAPGAARAPMPATTSAVLQRTYERYDADPKTGSMRVVTIADAKLEYEILSAEVATNPALADIAMRWAATDADTVRATIARMIGAPIAGHPFAVIGEAIGTSPQPNRAWRFPNRESAARAVLGESMRGYGERKEKALAEEVLSSNATAHILAGVRGYVQKLLPYIAGLVSAGQVPPEFANQPGEYWYYYLNTFIPRDPLDVLKEDRYDLPTAVATLKDISSAFMKWYAEEYKKADAGGVADPEAERAIMTPPGKAVARHEPTAHAGAGTEDIEKTVRPQGGKLVEGTASMKYARSNMMLVDVGPSFSTGRLMQLGTAIGAAPEEQQAVALALFAFWNKLYWRSTSGIHHFHFVMDMLENYVPGSYDYRGYPASIQSFMSATLKAL